ncbi:MAG: hypothetical protein COW30_10920 [Rhodospirillales bacterium CG15_BIG_FIL_POST_REV_8_21_14_020_66_15]|nr:MAG: hypothetical protein COW30_10920 [Rhodospirillales bacterium CG15_BIG_FIL_POST_REV_8_21_14_020_66_15]
MGEPYFPWADRYDTGIQLIDNDHRRLFGIVNELHDLIENGGGPEDLKPITDDLILYTQVHFEREEILMDEYRFPHLQAHRKLHHDFVRMIYGIRKVEAESPEKLDLKKMLVFLEGWLRRHVLKADREYIPYLKGDYGRRKSDLTIPVAKASGLSGETPQEQEEVTVSLKVPYAAVQTLRRCANLLRQGGDHAAPLEALTDPVAAMDIEDALEIAKVVLR